MKKLLTLSLMLLVSFFAFSATTVTNIRWADDNGSDRDMEQGKTYTIKFDYTADASEVVYVVLNFVNSSGAWNNYVYSSPINVDVAATSTTSQAEIAVPADAFITPKGRVFVTNVENGFFGSKVHANSELLYSNIVAASESGGEESTLVLTALAWSDDTSAEKDIDENTNVDIKVAYTGSAGESIYAIISYKDAWGTIIAAIESVLPSGDGSATISVPVRAYDGTIPTGDVGSFDKFRIIIGLTDNAAWGDRYDFGADGNAGNDAVYGNVVEPSNFALTAINWVDGTTSNRETVEGANDTIKISYTGAGEMDSAQVVVTAKYVGANGTWNNTMLNQKVHCPSGQDSVLFIFSMHAFNTTEDTDGHNNYRIFFSSNGGVAWGDRIDLGSDSDANNDVVYGVVKQSTATARQEMASISSKLYPNPSTGLVNLTLANDAQVSIFDLSGRTVYSAFANAGQNAIDLSSCNKGLYLVNINEGSGVKTLKLQIK